MENSVEIPHIIKNRTTCDLPSIEREEKGAESCVLESSSQMFWSQVTGMGPMKVPHQG